MSINIFAANHLGQVLLRGAKCDQGAHKQIEGNRGIPGLYFRHPRLAGLEQTSQFGLRQALTLPARFEVLAKCKFRLYAIMVA